MIINLIVKSLLFWITVAKDDLKELGLRAAQHSAYNGINLILR